MTGYTKSEARTVGLSQSGKLAWSELGEPPPNKRMQRTPKEGEILHVGAEWRRR
ncbi:hypothetical protein LIP_0969 [Limnochorda pilosa]|uniref:Uncharacterized protein n=1 Tax=Limnochorda pilosa TaxID=1555112 RepID=A0A0K2SI71_LIMPI|nr:hypothetical protein LIP_0969 [Limnochorda pilosa]